MSRFTVRTPTEQNNVMLQGALQNMGVIQKHGQFNQQVDPEFDYLARAEQMAHRANNMDRKTAEMRQDKVQVVPTPVAVGPVAGGKPGRKEFRALLQAISGKESGGNYGAVNKDSGALGKYQIMPSNLGGTGSGWDYDALGRDVSTQEFLSNPRIQERIARHRLRNYYKQHGVEGAASAWYSGDPNKWKTSKGPQGSYPSIYSYVMDILNRMGR